MNKPLPATPFYVLIVAKTRFTQGFCVGGITQNGRSVRLCAPPRMRGENSNCEYEIADVWQIDQYKLSSKIEPPHTEDIEVLSSKLLKISDRLLEAIERFMPPVVGGIESLFAGAVQRTADGRLYIGRENVPDHSTHFWRPDRDLHRVDTWGGKFRYVYAVEEGDCSFSYVGTANAKPVLAAGTLLRLSLARWWRPDDKPEQEEACHVQVSGWFDEHGSTGEADDGDAVHVETTHVVQTSVDPHDRKPVIANVDDLLKRYFGFDSFRPHQREIIESVLVRRDTLVIMSTGAGKSLCYQLPALAFPGLTVVISPLISLMQDQVTKLEQLGIPVATLNSHTESRDSDRIIRAIRSGQLKLLYLSPERLAMQNTVELLQGVKVECLVVDEAHCISQWGHDFRTEYRQIVHVRQALGNPPVLAVTATATPEVQTDIVANLSLRAANEFVAPFNRPNLFLAVQPRHNGTRQTLDFLKAHTGQAGIIYCSTRKTADALAETLQQAGIQALPYHAGLDQATREQNQRRFVHEEAVVMVATVAFGMGIDKPDIRFVLHYNLASDPEGYYQQIGRAGRDGDRAECLLLHAPEDFGTIEFMIARGEPDRAAQAAARLQHMKTWVKEYACRRKWLLAYFGENDAPDNCGMCDACVQVAGTQAAGSDEITAYASLFLNCIKEVRQKFGRDHIIKILSGSKEAKLASWKHDKLPSYGQGNALTRAAWKELAVQFFQMGLVVTDDVGAVKLTPRGEAVLEGEKVYGDLKHRSHATATASATTSESYDAELFEKLRTLRRELAEARGVPSFVIFSDRTLRDMAARLPQTPDEFLQIHGVGERKAAEFSEAFLEIIREYRNRNPFDTPIEPVLQVAKPKIGSVQARRELAIGGLQAGKSLDAVADECGVQPATVLRYLYDHFRKNGTLPQGIIVPHAQVPSEIRAEVFTHFAECGTDALGPIYWAMEERVEYIDLDLLRLEYLQPLPPIDPLVPEQAAE